MSHKIDLYWSNRSPYCFLVAKRLNELTARADVEINIKPIYPVILRMKNFFKQMNPLAPAYFFRDITREGERLGTPLTWPDPDPVLVERFETGEVAAEQPHIYRLTHASVLAQEQGRGMPFLYETSKLIFGGTKDWHLGSHLADAYARAGLDLAAIDEQVEAQTDRIREVVEQNQADQEQAGHWGVPLMIYDDEPFFGQDRFDALLWRMRQNGLAE